MPSALIVDDEADVRFLIYRLLERVEGVTFAGQASSGEEAIARWRELRPDVIVLDHRMPGLSGLETAERILAEDPDQVIVLFTAFNDPAVERAAAELGIRACLSKGELNRLPAELLLHCPDQPD